MDDIRYEPTIKGMAAIRGDEHVRVMITDEGLEALGMTKHTVGEMLEGIVEALYDPTPTNGETKLIPGYPHDRTWVELDTVASNYDHEIDRTIAERLQKEPKTFSQYAGWNFNGLVVWDVPRSTWRCEVWTYGEPREIVEAASLEEIMRLVCEKYGDD